MLDYAGMTLDARTKTLIDTLEGRDHSGIAPRQVIDDSNALLADARRAKPRSAELDLAPLEAASTVAVVLRQLLEIDRAL